MTVMTSEGTVRYAVLIPSKGRAVQWVKSLRAMPWLNAPSTYLGVEWDETAEYRTAMKAAAITWMGQLVSYHNPQGSVAVAREHLRRSATKVGYDYYVATDDNAKHKSESVLDMLVRCATQWPKTIVAGYHNTAAHFDRGRISYAEYRGEPGVDVGTTSYPQVAMILQVYGHALYADYTYPPDAFGLDDRHLALHALKLGYNFRVCMDAPFNKVRYQAGGQGPVTVRAWKTGMAIARLASDFPEYVGARGTLTIPWQFLLDARAGGGITANRLAGGSMRKESTLNRRLVIKRRRL